ncbi:hypothetical protein E1H12_16685 [Geitlerinema sp. P-1104]|nr:hypothetical protein [Geitlerinema sp. P-1104]
MTIADIYDALTAGDRPYKTKRSIHQALAILDDEANKYHVNPDLLKLFKEQEVFQVLGHDLDP